jgi:hypothetical protein
MREFGNKITLTKNFRGVYDLDTSKGCCSGLKNNPKGCYNDCYAARYSFKYGYDFTKTILRHFENNRHKEKIINQINKIELPFIRIGVTGDPSENWQHTLNVIEDIKDCNKQIVIITKHWNLLTVKQLEQLSKYNVCINTSVSALDNKLLLKHRISQYNTLKNYCKSVLRIISCDYNIKNKLGKQFNKIQDKLFNNENVLDTVLRVYKKNEYATSGIINIDKIKFLGKNCHFSIKNKKAFIGYCNDCVDMCGINL